MFGSASVRDTQITHKGGAAFGIRSPQQNARGADVPQSACGKPGDSGKQERNQKDKYFFIEWHGGRGGGLGLEQTQSASMCAW